MAYEIERKFLVSNDSFIHLANKFYHIQQGYICNDPARSVRIRKKGTLYFITIKGESTHNGLIRPEWEQPIDEDSFEILWSLCLPGKISKTRYEVSLGHHTIEVDIFHDTNVGLIMAEIELQTEKDIIQLPDWLGEEVTGEEQYYNAYLSEHPFKTWNNLK